MTLEHYIDAKNRRILLATYCRRFEDAAWNCWLSGIHVESREDDEDWPNILNAEAAAFWTTIRIVT